MVHNVKLNWDITDLDIMIQAMMYFFKYIYILFLDI
jgi:hypothetical protein